MKNIFITSGAPSKILTDKKSEQIEETLRDRPYEAVAMARKLLDEYEDDERVLALYIRTGLRAQALTGKRYLQDDWLATASKVGKERFFSPVFSVLGIAADAAMGIQMGKEHLSSLRRAHRMGPEVVRELVKDLLPLFGGNTDEVRRITS